MGLEIERKYLVINDTYKTSAIRSIEISQAYLSDNPDCTVRVRVSGERGYITVKSRNDGAVRHEWEYAVPAGDAAEMTRIAVSGCIAKTRYIVPFASHTWEVDVFHGALDGLVVAEIELGSADETFELPDFVGKEVTGDARYYNSALVHATEPPR